MFAAMKIFSGTAHPALADRICSYLGVKRSDATVNPFPNGETFVKINENVRGSDMFIIQPTCPPTNHNLMELLIMVDAAKRASAERITAVIPFFGYARQDRKDQPRVPITAKLVANLLTAAGVQRVLTVDLHAGQIQGFFDIPVDHLYAAPVIIRYLKQHALTGDNVVVVSPDVGGIKMTHSFSKSLGSDFAIVAKARSSATEVKALNVIGEVDGRDVLLVDDMTETAGTLTAAAKLLRERGAKRILAGVSHAILNDLAIKRLAESEIEELICTDSTPMAQGPKVTTLSVAEILGEAIRRIHQGESVTSLFDIR
ncbi:MAG TPA: ribose-phosphate pyrophosphokinase [Verrucomicrobiales bacterium]|jgi:ribose-phosphate pyrophosphokinase|nr:ribose-phosphate pyrophosphokinase [Verrucomicrobiales bacterium]